MHVTTEEKCDPVRGTGVAPPRGVVSTDFALADGRIMTVCNETSKVLDIASAKVPCQIEGETYYVDRTTFNKMQPGTEYLLTNPPDYVIRRHDGKLLARKLEQFPRLSELEA